MAPSQTVGRSPIATLLEMTKAPPTVEPTPVMPVPDDEAMRRARRKSIAGQMRRRGRQSTILTDQPLGGGI